ncbi:pyridoxamine 5'-phosphate oxidase [Rhodobacterales bacterium HKCCE3408]|nr:pyridoxamine 5'-phosphate oxidase [Rhodobacterales bacterium HKCCE3408]
MLDATTTDIAFTPAVKAVQEALGSRAQMEVMSTRRGFRTEITPDLAAFLAVQRSFFLASASADGRPYIQHRGGEPGFIEIRDGATIAIPDYPGNRQYITFGNLSENDRVALFFIDYEAKQRIKVWGRARVENIDDKAARTLVIAIEAWDVNCPQHLPDLYTPATVARVTETLQQRIRELEAEVARLSA